ncbi:MAG: putative sulfate exporter family transporter [Saprospiraceae bacterium]
MENQPFYKKWSEDIWAVCIASILILGVLTAAFIMPESSFKAATYGWSSFGELSEKVLAVDNLTKLLGIAVLFSLFALGAVKGSSSSIHYIKGFAVIFLLGLVSLIIAGNKTINYYGIEYVIFGLILGLSISNLKLAPDWLTNAARSEFFIKTGLVILGCSVLFTDIIKAGLPGIIQAVVVVLVVWTFALWLSRKLGVDDEMGVILASAVSICGVSAAIVASGAIQGDKKKLSYVTTIVLLMAVPMLILQPWIIRYFGIPEIVGGAWLGGTLDTTASVTAASQLVGPLALKAGVIVKFSQNVLMGVAALLIAAWWTYTKNPESKKKGGNNWILIWERFPKFVLGFLAVSLLFSFVIPSAQGKQVTGFLNGFRTIWFAMAFVSIGLEAKFSELFGKGSGKPALAFVGAQFFNLIWTLIWAYLLFGGYLLPVPDLQ